LRAQDPGPQSFPSDVVTRTLDNGLRFVARSVPGLPVTSTMIWYRAGSADEVTGKTGIAHLLEHMMFKGTGCLRQGQIDRLTQRHGGVNNAFTWIDSTAYYFNFARDRWRVALDIEADRMGGCLLNARELGLEKAVVIEERSAEMDAPEGVLLEEVNRTAFHTHPYGQPIIGWLEDLVALEPEDLWRFYETYYVPGNAHVVMVGDFDVDEAFGQVASAFGGIAGGAPVPRRRIVEPPQRAERRVLLERECEAPHLSMAYHVPEADHPDTPALTLLDILLSTGRTSRLHSRLVDREKVATSVDTALYDTAQPYLLFASAELHPGASLQAAERLLDEEIERLASRGPSKTELEKAKKLFAADWVLDHQTAEDQAVRLGEALCWGSLESLARLPQAVAQAGSHDVQRVAEHYLRRSNRTVGHLVPARRNPGFVSLYVPPAARGARQPRRERPVPRTAWRLAGLSREVPDFQVRCERFVLQNGLVVLALPEPSVPSAYLELLVPTGSRFDPDEKLGRGQLLGRMLHEGTERRSAERLALEAERIGAKLDAGGAYRSTRISVEVLREDLDRGLDLLSDVALRSCFPAEALEDRRREQLTYIARIADDPQREACRAFNELVYRAHPAGRPALGRPKSVAALVREDLLAEWRQAFVPTGSVLAVAGDFGGLEPLRGRLERYLGRWEARRAPERPEVPAPRLQRSMRRKALHRDREQVHLYVGHLGIRRTDADFEAALVLDHVLGQGAGLTDRLSQRLRDREGLAYTVWASLAHGAEIDPGTFVAYAATAPGNVPRALSGIREELERIREEPVPARELGQVKSFMLGQYPFGFQTNRDLAGYALACEQYGLGLDYHRRFLEAVARVGPEEVQRVARARLHPEALTVAAAGPVREKDLELA
jgi:zinc protease